MGVTSMEESADRSKYHQTKNKVRGGIKVKYACEKHNRNLVGSADGDSESYEVLRQTSPQAMFSSMAVAANHHRDKWSKRGVSSAVSISLADEHGNEYGKEVAKERQDESHSGCWWLRKLLGNYILPGVFGIYRYRVVERLHWKHLVSQELLANSIYFCSKLHCFFKNELMTEVKNFASQLYFPIGQIEADGMSVISGEVWAATYLLLGLHKRMREADFHAIRNEYASVAWDSARVTRVAEEYHRNLQTFRSKIIPLWNQVEKLAELDLNDFAEIDSPKGIHGKPTPLPKLQIKDEYLLQNTLNLKVIPEKEFGGKEKEPSFEEMDYGSQVQIIKSLISQPGSRIQAGCAVMQSNGERLKAEMLCVDSVSLNIDKDLTCTRAITILIATLKILLEEVDLPSGLRYDVIEWIRCVSEELNSYLGYAEWITHKFSEFQSMISLCYNFALLCFDLDLPSFQTIQKREGASETVYKPELIGSNDLLSYKVVSITELMSDASKTFVSPGKQAGVDEDFDWQDFYKTEYHMVLRRLPLRVGQNLLQFRDHSEPTTQQKIGATTPETAVCDIGGQSSENH